MMTATSSQYKGVLKDPLWVSEKKEQNGRRLLSFFFYGLLLIKGEFIGCVRIITCGNSPHTFKQGRFCKVHQHINTALAKVLNLWTNVENDNRR